MAVGYYERSLSRGKYRGKDRERRTRGRRSRSRSRSGRRRRTARERSRDRDRSRDRHRDRDRRRRRDDSSSSGSCRARYEHRAFHAGHASYDVGRRVGKGSFGHCYAGFERGTGRPVCLKVEDGHAVEHPKLSLEYDYLSMLQDGMGRDELVTPRVFDLIHNGRDDVLVQELLGPSIESLYQKCGQRLSEHTVLMLAPQVIDCIQHVHERGLLHRDIKPHNFLLGRGERAHMVYIIDFGLSKRWRRSDGSHAAFRLGRSLTGTARYVSLNVHRGYEQSRRDDMLSIGHMLLYLVRGKLPWQGLGDPGPGKERHEAIHEVKEQTALTDLCRGLAPQWLEFMQYCRGLEFTERPHYAYIKDLFRGAMRYKGYKEDWAQYDWRCNGVHVEGRPPSRRPSEEHCGARTLCRSRSASDSPPPHVHHCTRL
eukprot:TRINITY_DN12513_c0_g1_i1.p1 TRINITY_DN12513_c0_g1~~TRINITY_DN12513_c0_g1_i1.p1  ORF type:complete len:454 (+),score=143.18 TRINITY_DN12513_c0_g1_i1:88-1362(+)